MTLGTHARCVMMEITFLGDRRFVNPPPCSSFSAPREIVDATALQPRLWRASISMMSSNFVVMLVHMSAMLTISSIATHGRCVTMCRQSVVRWLMKETEGQHNPSRCSSLYCHQCSSMFLARECDSHYMKQHHKDATVNVGRTYVRHVPCPWQLVHHELLVVDRFLDAESRVVSRCRMCPHPRRWETSCRRALHSLGSTS